MHSLVAWTLVYVGIIALDEGGWAKWQWTKSGVSSGGRNSEGVIVVSGDMWRAYTHFAQMKVGFCSLLGCWHNSLCGCANQALASTRYPTRPGLFFFLPEPDPEFFQNFRVQGSSYI